MNNRARWSSMISLALLLIAEGATRAEDPPAARAALPPPVAASSSKAQSGPPADAFRQQEAAQQAAKPVIRFDEPSTDRPSPDDLERVAGADRPTASAGSEGEQAGDKEHNLASPS